MLKRWTGERSELTRLRILKAELVALIIEPMPTVEKISEERIVIY